MQVFLSYRRGDVGGYAGRLSDVLRQRAGRVFAPTAEVVTAGTAGDALIGFEVTCVPEGFMQLIVEDDKARISVTDEGLDPGAC